jgi:hypothetical protein
MKYTDAHVYGAFNIIYGVGSAGDIFLPAIQSENLTPHALPVGPVIIGAVSQFMSSNDARESDLSSDL